MLGLKRGTVALYPHEKAWEREAARTIKTLWAILGDAAADIRHVGSTSIPAICAKPIVDIAVAARSFDQVLEKRPVLKAHGFYHRPGKNIENQELFACGSYYDGSGEEQTRFIHVVPAGSPDWQDYLNFRDYLNAFPEAAKAYEALKKSLAAANPEDAGREKYLAGKHAFVRETLQKAAEWVRCGRPVP